MTPSHRVSLKFCLPWLFSEAAKGQFLQTLIHLFHPSPVRGEQGRVLGPFPLCRKASYLDNELREGICDNFQKLRGILSILEVEGFHYQVGQALQVMGGSLQRQKHQHREPVEEVMDGGPCKGPAGGEPHPEPD